jgi:hypothetical protein
VSTVSGSQNGRDRMSTESQVPPQTRNAVIFPASPLRLRIAGSGMKRAGSVIRPVQLSDSDDQMPY